VEKVIGIYLLLFFFIFTFLLFLFEISFILYLLFCRQAFRFSWTCSLFFSSFAFDRYLSCYISSGLHNFILPPMIPTQSLFLPPSTYSLCRVCVRMYIHNTHILFIFCSRKREKRKFIPNKATEIHIEHSVNRMTDCIWSAALFCHFSFAFVQFQLKAKNNNYRSRWRDIERTRWRMKMTAQKKSTHTSDTVEKHAWNNRALPLFDGKLGLVNRYMYRRVCKPTYTPLVCVWPRHPRASMQAGLCSSRTLRGTMEQQMMLMPAELPLVELFDALLFLQLRLFFPRQFCPLWRSAHARSTQIPAMIDKAEPRGITCSFLSFFLFLSFFPIPTFSSSSQIVYSTKMVE